MDQKEIRQRVEAEKAVSSADDFLVFAMTGDMCQCIVRGKPSHLAATVSSAILQEGADNLKLILMAALMGSIGVKAIKTKEEE